MNPAELKELIELMADALEPECWLADVVMQDLNLADSHIDFCLEHIAKTRDEFMKSHPGAATARINILVSFLKWLRKIPPEVRDEAGN